MYAFYKRLVSNTNTSKVKSMQMFRKNVKSAKQGDRVGICVTNFDSSLIERGIATSLNCVQKLKNIVCLVKRVRFYDQACISGTKFHISIGHSTVLGTATFFGFKELEEQEKSKKTPIAEMRNVTGSNYLLESHPRAHQNTKKQPSLSINSGSSLLVNNQSSEFPDISFSHEQEFFNQDEFITLNEEGKEINSPQWALIKLQQPVYCPIGSLIIASRLDAEVSAGATHTAKADGPGVDLTMTSSSSHCRLAFYGPIKAALPDDKENELPKFYTIKSKQFSIFKVSDKQKGLCYEAIGEALISKNGDIKAFIGMYAEMLDTEIIDSSAKKKNFSRNNSDEIKETTIGKIIGPYGSEGKLFNIIEES